MTNTQGASKPKAAMLANVTALLECVDRLKGRASHLPGLAVLYGPSGYGKSVAATVAMSMHDAAYVEAKPSWTKRALLEAIAVELGVVPAKLIYKTAEACGEELAASQRVLLIDEADILVARGLIETVRELHMLSEAPIVLIGEEALPGSLKATERVHNRVLEWVPAAAATLQDARALADMYVHGTHVADDLLALFVERTKGRIRRIVVNLDRIHDAAAKAPPAEGVATRAWWGERDIYTGEAPPKRKVA